MLEFIHLGFQQRVLGFGFGLLAEHGLLFGFQVLTLLQRFGQLLGFLPGRQ